MTKVYALLLLCLFALVLPIVGQEAEFKKVKENWMLWTGGSQVYRHVKVLTLYTHAAISHIYGESFITCDPHYQTLEIYESYTRQKGGNVVKTPDNAFVEVLPAVTANAPVFSALREVVVVHTRLELGATVYLDYSITSKPGYLPEINVCRQLKQSPPVKKYEIGVAVPRRQRLEYAPDNLKSKPLVTEREGMERVSWVLKNLPVPGREPQVSVIGDELPLLTATAGQRPMTSLSAQREWEADARLHALTGKLTAGAKNDGKEVRALHSYVIDNLYYSPLPLSETAYHIRPTAEMFRSAYAAEVEKANLLAALLRVADPKAEIGAVCVPSADTASLRVGSIHELFVWTEAGDRQQALSLKGKTPSVVSWQKDYAYVAMLTQPFELNLPSAILNKEYTLQPDKAKAGNGYLVFALPVERGSLANSQYVHYNSKRTPNLLLPEVADETFTYLAETPESIRLTTPAVGKRIDNAVGTLIVSILSEGGQMRVVRSLRLEKQIIRPADYTAFRQSMIEYGAVDKQTPVYKSK